MRLTSSLCLSVALITGCATGPTTLPTTPEQARPAPPKVRVTLATIYRKIGHETLRRAIDADGSVRSDALRPAVGAGMADLVADALQRLVADHDVGRALRAGSRPAVAALLLRTEDDRDVTVLSDWPKFVPGGCVKLFERSGRSDYPRIAPASGCLR